MSLIGTLAELYSKGDYGAINDPLAEFMGRETNLGNQTSTITDMLKGFNHLKNAPTGTNRPVDLHSKVFIVRPQLNCSARNLARNRLTADYITKSSETIGAYCRMMLDPRLGAIGDGSLPPLHSKLVNNEQAFIPALTNNFHEISGWTPTAVDSYTSAPGKFKEEYTYIDGTHLQHGSRDIDITFNNTKGDVIAKLFKLWVIYPPLVRMGILEQYADFIRAVEYDYNTRIYELKLTPDGKYVRGIATTGISNPVVLNDAGRFNGSNEEPYGDNQQTSTYRFKSSGVSYDDPISIYNFNQTVGYFSPSMRLLNENKEGHGLVKIEPKIRQMFRFDGYPRINFATLELEWWVEESLVNTLLDKTISSVTNILKG